MLKKLGILLCCAALSVVLTACSPGREAAVSSDMGESRQNESGPAVGSFCYRDVLSAYKDGDAGVVTCGFQNTENVSPKTAEDFIALAKKEARVGYDQIFVERDADAGVYAVYFSMRGSMRAAARSSIWTGTAAP